MSTNSIFSQLKLDIGRNARCFCGSGEKYKNCCIYKFGTAETFEHKYAAFIHFRRKVFPKLHEILISYYGDDSFEELLSCHWNNPLLDNEERKALENDLEFEKYVLFRSLNLFVHQVLDPDVPENWNKALSLLKGKISSVEQEFVLSLKKQHCSFFQIRSKDPASLQIVTEDIFSKKKYVIVDKALAETGPLHAVISGIIFPFINGTWFLEAPTNFAIRPTRKTWLIDFMRDDYKLNKEGEVTIQKYLRGRLYLLIWTDMLTALEYIAPRPLKFTNRSGDDIVITKARYLLKDMKSVFTKLQKIKGINLEEKSKGKYSLLWLDKNNTIWGRITLDKSYLVFESNSVPRFEKFQGLIRNIKELRLQDTSQEDIETALGRSSSTSLPEETKPYSKEEIRQMSEQLFKEYYKKWVNEKIPALGNKTPLQACRTARGREEVKNLIDEQEMQNRNMPEDEIMFYFDPNKLRESLGLD